MVRGSKFCTAPLWDIAIPKKVPSIDTAKLARHAGHDPELQRTLLGLFVGQAGVMLQRLQEAAGDPSALADAIHLIKGSALAIGATRSATAAEVAEAAMSAEGQSNEELAAAVARLRIALAEACDHAARLLRTP